MNSEPVGARALRRALHEQHGESLGDLLADAELARRQKLINKYKQQKAELESVNRQLAKLDAELMPQLLPFTDAIERAQAASIAAWEAHQAAVDRHNQLRAPLLNRTTELVKAMNEPTGVNAIIQQWTVPDWFNPLPEAPPMPTDLGSNA
jgi:hypothetical protein